MSRLESIRTNSLVGTRTLNFKFDGVGYEGREGDSLASALIANNVSLVGRSFKYHRPRGILSDGLDEPNALVELQDGDNWRPNIKATEISLFDGLVARSQNRFPSLNFDLMAVNDLLSPFIGAGFYYKTFKYPKSFWERVYEPIIRRAAGLGRLPKDNSTEHYERGFLFCDLLIIGGGLAGLYAALRAGEAAKDVILIDNDAQLGGRLLKDSCMIDGRTYDEWRKSVVERLNALPNVRIKTSCVATGSYDGGIYSAVETLTERSEGDSNLPLKIFWRIAAKTCLLATGAFERSIAFPNNDRPGVMLAASVRSYINRYGVMAGEKVAIFTNNDDGWRTAFELVELGRPPVAVIDTRPDHGYSADFPIYHGVVTDVQGRKAVKNVKIRTARGTHNIEVDCLAVSGGWNPNFALASHKGQRPIWNETMASFVPNPNVDGHLYPVGAANGTFDDYAIIDETEAVLRDLFGTDLGEFKRPMTHSLNYRIAPFWHTDAPGRAWVDFQNDVTTKDIALAHRENFMNVEHMKRYTTLGMATDQGRTANVVGMAIMAELTGRSIPETGTTTFRPPYNPTPVGLLGAGGAGQGFAPHRELPSQPFISSQNAPTVEAGLWHRPSFFRQGDESHWRHSTDREALMVRSHVGLSDVSSLGKIELVGRDAAKFLDRVYTGRMSTLKVGQIRYGLMLREDGFVLDDGTCTRIDDTRYVITTTTAAAGAVIMHLGFVHQCLIPDLDVRFASITDHTAQFAITGPKARDVLSELVDADLSNEALPFMRYQAVHIGGVNARLFRISFSGELGYEIGVPRRYGASLFEHLLNAVRQHGGDVYGLEALNVLRIEKGFITHNEIHGRTTAQDIGFAKMLSPSKDFIGKTMAHRPHLIDDAAREHLVGIKPVGAVQKLLAGSRMIGIGETTSRENLEGAVTSVCYSPTLGHMIGLAFVKNGRNRIGQQIRAVDLVRDFDTLVEIVNPDFIDPDGGRMRG